ncbi:MAG: multicopper oxidase domain-containing protein [Candidatus Eremiobacteraeota bacterium]|nr:multicopper oxidase domain-containing protein [Candidatus Eremiobacteraeota bacterium]MBC5826187.1 multicopper oxidase domain-containing protein [Candidatus Eremiobacteraeota bacterium]
MKHTIAERPTRLRPFGVVASIALAAATLWAAAMPSSMAVAAPLTGGQPPSPSDIAQAEATAQRDFDRLPALPPVAGGAVKTFRLIGEVKPWTIAPGVTTQAWTYNGTVPGPTLHVRQGDRVRVLFTNELPEPTTIHWHGVSVPADMDGVPGLSQPAINPGQSFVYEFVARDAGTYIYHTHDDDLNQLDRGLYGAFIVDPKAAPRLRDDRDYLMLLSSWRLYSGAENFFSMNGKSYPLTRPFRVRRGQRIRIREINISGTEFHTMHIHGHHFKVVAVDGQDVPAQQQQSMVTVTIGPGETRDVAFSADAQPGTWLIHCHIADHMMNGRSGPGGLISAVQYEGAPERLPLLASADVMAMGPPAADASPSEGGSTIVGPPLKRSTTWILGAIAGLTIFFGLPFAALRNVAPKGIALLNAIAIGVLFFLLFDILRQAGEPVAAALQLVREGARGGEFVSLLTTYVAGLAAGLVGLVYFSKNVVARYRHAAAGGVVSPMALATTIALGIGAHNFSEGLAIGQSAATGAVQLAVLLIVGFGLHNMTEGFGIAAPLAGTGGAGIAAIVRLGIIGGAPTFVGTVLGYRFTSPLLSVAFLTVAAGAIMYVIGELTSAGRKIGFKELATIGVFLGFVVGYGTDLLLTVAGA